MSSHRKPYCLEEPPTASESEDVAGLEKLRVETKVNVELHQGNKVSQNGDVSQNESPPSQPNSNQLPRRGELFYILYIKHKHINRFVYGCQTIANNSMQNKNVLHNICLHKYINVIFI